MDKELEKHLESLAWMELKEKEYSLRLRDFSEEMNKGTRERIVSLLATFFYRGNKGTQK